MFLNCGVGEDSWESLGLQGDPTSPSKGDQSWVFIVRIDAKAETPIFWPPDAKSWLIGKDPDAGREKGTTEDEMAGWHHRLNGHEFEQTAGDSEGQKSLVYCNPWGRKELDTTSVVRTTAVIWTGQFSSVQSLSRVQLFETPWIAARQASLSITNPWGPPKHMSIESMMPSSHLILCRPLFLLHAIPPSIRVFSNDSTLHMRWPKYLPRVFTVNYIFLFVIEK